MVLSWFVILELPMSDAPDFLADLSPRIASTFFDQFGDQFLHVNSVVPTDDQVVSSNDETFLLASIRQPFWCADTDVEGFFTRSSPRTHHRTDPETSILGVRWGMQFQPVHVRGVNSFYLCRYHLISRCPFEMGRPPATTFSSKLACTFPSLASSWSAQPEVKTSQSKTLSFFGTPVFKSTPTTSEKSTAARTQTSILLSANFAVLKLFSNIYQIVGGNPSSAIHGGTRFCSKTEGLANQRVDLLHLEVWRSRAQKPSLLLRPALFDWFEARITRVSVPKSA